MGISQPYPRGKYIKLTEIKEPSLLEVKISSINSKNAILTTIHFQHGKIRAVVDIRVKLNLIHLGEVERLKIPYQKRKEPIILRIFDGTNPTYERGKAYLETQK